MLDSNTDRMWYVIGAVIVLSGLLFFMNDQYPDMFSDLMAMFRDESEVEYVAAEVGETEVEIPYDIEYTMNDSEEAVRPGEKGMKIVYSDGREQVIKEPVNRIEMYPYEGRMVPFGVEYTSNPDKPVGWSEVTQEGVDGEFFDFYNPHNSSEILGEYDGIRIPPIPKIIDRGSAPWVTIAYDTEYTLNHSQVRSGTNGRKYVDSKGKDHIDIHPINRVLLYPTRTETISHTTTRKASRDLLVGEERVVNSGKNGSKTVHYHPVTKEVVKEVTNVAPVQRVIEYGTTTVENVPFETTYTTNSKLVRNGAYGKKYVYDNGTTHIFQKPVNQVRMYSQSIEYVNYTTRYVDSSALNYGVEKVHQNGARGENIKYYHPVTGDYYTTVVVKKPVERIIHRGTKPTQKYIPYTVKEGDRLWLLTNQSWPWIDWIVANNSGISHREDTLSIGQEFFLDIEYSNGIRLWKDRNGKPY